MSSFKMALLCLLISLPAIAGLSCFECVDIRLDTDSQALKDFFGGHSTNLACRAPVDPETTKLPVKTCSGASDGQVNTCIFGIFTATVTLKGESAKMTYTTRGCLGIPEDKADTCEKESMPPGIADDMVSNAEGSACFCSTDKCNGQTRLIPTVGVFSLSLFAFHFLRE